MSDKSMFIDISLARDAFDVIVKTDIAARGLTAIFGPSGAGKSSLLRAIAGLETPEKGQIILGSTPLFDSAAKINIPPHKRRVGYLFQDARLFSHLNVKANLDYAQKRAPQNSGPDIDDIIGIFDLGALLAKDVKTLSGGEQQRVALARSVLSRPDILLLDEPFAGLDAARKVELTPFIRALPARLNMPIIFVSHDIKEVGTLADDIICLREGRITASGPALTILPRLQPCADLEPDFASWFDVRLTAIDRDYHAETWSLSERHKLILPLNVGSKIGDKSRLSIGASDVSIALTPPQDISIQNKLAVKIRSVTLQGNRILLRLYVPDVDSLLPELCAFITPLAQADLKLKAGQNVTALVKSVSLTR